MAEAEDPTPLEAFMAEAEDSAAAADSAEGLAGDAGTAAGERMAAARGEAGLGREDLAADRLAADLHSEDLAAGARAWDGTFRARAAVWEAQAGLRAFQERSWMGAGTRSEIARA